MKAKYRTKRITKVLAKNERSNYRHQITIFENRQKRIAIIEMCLIRTNQVNILTRAVYEYNNFAPAEL